MKDDGGPAFPYSVQRLQSTYHAEVKGMTLRDWFAGMAMEGLIAHHGDPLERGEMASRAYLSADAMIAARKEN